MSYNIPPLEKKIVLLLVLTLSICLFFQKSVKPVYSFAITKSSTEITVNRESSAKDSIKIHNRSKSDSFYKIDSVLVENDNLTSEQFENIIKLDSTEFSIEAGKNKSIEYRISPNHNTPLGDYAFIIYVYEINQEEDKKELEIIGAIGTEIKVRILDQEEDPSILGAEIFNSLEVEYKEITRPKINSPGKYEILIKNSSNYISEFYGGVYCSGSNQDSKYCEETFQNDIISLEPNEEYLVQIEPNFLPLNSSSFQKDIKNLFEQKYLNTVLTDKYGGERIETFKVLIIDPYIYLVLIIILIPLYTS